MIQLVWFRSDLRTLDHQALINAMDSGPTIAVYFLCETQWQSHDIGDSHRDLIYRQLEDLHQLLADLNVPLIIRLADTFFHIPKLLGTLCQNHNVESVYFHHEYEHNERACTEHVCSYLSSLGISVRSFHDQCLFVPGSIRNQQGGPFKVFSAFKRRALKGFLLNIRAIACAPRPQPNSPAASDITAIQGALRNNPIKLPFDGYTLWPTSQEIAHESLTKYVVTRIKKYHKERDYPALNTTSQLSHFLSTGVLTTRQCVQALLSSQGHLTDPGSEIWLNEILWREFYRHIMVAYPSIVKYKPFLPNTDQLPWSQQNPLFTCWCDGKTGYPFVDAGMRQLKQTGWMHNRLRMVVAMFLTKQLFIDWRLGEAYFAQHLIDFDFASNNGGWQWSASTGVDAAPYFRVFNPTRQSERFDPRGDFIRQYVRELAHLSDRDIHNPTNSQRMAAHYPTPIVDHKMAVDYCKAHFKALNASEQQEYQQA